MLKYWLKRRLHVDFSHTMLTVSIISPIREPTECHFAITDTVTALCTCVGICRSARHRPGSRWIQFIFRIFTSDILYRLTSVIVTDLYTDVLMFAVIFDNAEQMVSFIGQMASSRLGGHIQGDSKHTLASAAKV